MMNVIASVILICVAVVWVIPVAESSCDFTACPAPSPATMNSTSNDTSAFCLQQNTYLSCLIEEGSSCDTLQKIFFDAAITAVKTIIQTITDCEITKLPVNQDWQFQKPARTREIIGRRLNTGTMTCNISFSPYVRTRSLSLTLFLISCGAPMTVYSMLLCLVCVTFSLLWR